MPGCDPRCLRSQEKALLLGLRKKIMLRRQKEFGIAGEIAFGADNYRIVEVLGAGGGAWCLMCEMPVAKISTSS